MPLLVESLRAHEPFWLKATASRNCARGHRPDGHFRRRNVGLSGPGRPPVTHLEITPLLEEVLEPDVFARLMDDNPGASARLDDELWVRSVSAFAAATPLGRTSVEHLADMFAPLYMLRASAFMAHTASESPAIVQARLDSLCETFLRLKPALVARWSVEV